MLCHLSYSHSLGRRIRTSDILGPSEMRYHCAIPSYYFFPLPVVALLNFSKASFADF